MLVTVLLPSILTVTMPPPVEASTRIASTSSLRRSCICLACSNIFLALAGSFMMSFLASPLRL